MTTTHSTWFSLISRVIPAVLLLTGLLAESQGHSPNYAANAAAIPRCADTQLTVSVATAPSGLGLAGMVIQYRNVSVTACSFTGYPDIVSLNFTTGKSHAVRRLRNGCLGGWRSYITERRNLYLWSSYAPGKVSRRQWSSGPIVQRPSRKGALSSPRYGSTRPAPPGRSPSRAGC